MRRGPGAHGLARPRWRLADLRRAAPSLAGYSLSGVSRLLGRLGVRRARGRLHVHSPDLEYAAKRALVDAAVREARERPDRVRVFYGDECGLYRQPTLAATYAPKGEEPLARLSHRANTCHRVAGALDAVTGRVVWTGQARVRVPALRRFLRALRAAAPAAARLVLVWDNWPVHRHPDVLAEAGRLGIELLWLPTYAPWLNPIEKLWRLLKQDHLHHHRLADDWDALRAQIAAALDRYGDGPAAAPERLALLRYAGLLPK